MIVQHAQLVGYCQRTDHVLPTQVTRVGTRLARHRQPDDHLTEGRLSGTIHRRQPVAARGDCLLSGWLVTKVEPAGLSCFFSQPQLNDALVTRCVRPVPGAPRTAASPRKSAEAPLHTAPPPSPESSSQCANATALTTFPCWVAPPLQNSTLDVPAHRADKRFPRHPRGRRRRRLAYRAWPLVIEASQPPRR